MNYLFVLGLATFASAFSIRAIDPMLNHLAADLHLSLREVASLASAFTLPYAAMQLVFGPIGDAVGKVRLVRLNLALLALGLIASALAPTHGVLFAARVFSGAFAGGIIPLVLATVGDRASFAERPVALSRVLLALILGQLAGSAVSGLIAEWVGWRHVFWTGAAVAAAAALANMLFLSETRTSERVSFGSALARYKVVFQNPLSLKLYAIMIVEGSLTFGVMPMVAPLMVAHKLGNAVEAGLALAIFAVGGAFYSLSVGTMVRTLGLRGMVALGALGYGVMLAGVGVTPNLPVVAGLFALMGFCFYLLHNVLQILATELAPEARGSAVALFAASFFMGQAIGAVSLAALAERTGVEAAFVLAGVGMVLLAYPVSRLPPRTAKPSAEGGA